MAQETTLQSVLDKAFHSQMDNIYTTMPGIVIRVRDNLQHLTVDVQPAINILREDGTQSERPVIFNVPVSMPTNREGGITHPLRERDNVLLLFSMRGIDLWKRGDGMPSVPSDYRKFDKKDCVAIPLQTIPNSVNNPLTRYWPHSTDDVVVFHNVGTDREAEVRFSPTGDVTVNTNQNVTVNASQSVVVNTQSVLVNADTLTANISATEWTGNINFSGNYSFDGTVTINGVVFEAHQHGGVEPGGGTTTGVV